MSSLKCFHLPDLDFLIFEICSEWSNRAGPAWTSPGPPRARRTRFFEKCSEWSEMARKLVFGKTRPGPPRAHRTRFFEKCSEWSEMARKLVFGKTHPGPPRAHRTRFLKNVQNDLKWRENWFLEMTPPWPARARPGPTLNMAKFWSQITNCSKILWLIWYSYSHKALPYGSCFMWEYSHHISLQYFRAVYSYMR